MSKNHLTTDQIILGCRAKDSQCQKALVEHFSDELYTVCLRYCGDGATAKDVLQESFIRIFKSFKNYDPEKGSLQSWMRKITVNMALKTLKKNSLQTHSLSLEISDSISTAPVAIEKMQAEDLMKIIRTLPEGYRQVFNMAVIEGYSHREIATLLKIEEASSRSNLSRAKQLLRKKLAAFKKNESWVRIG